MRALSEMIALDTQWKVVHPPGGAADTYGLFYGEDLVAQAQAVWQRMVSYDLMMWSEEGTYRVHVNLANPNRQAQAFMFGAQQCSAAFCLESEGFITVRGVVNTASGRELRWDPTHEVGYEYVMREINHAPLITLSATPDLGGIGGNPGHMNLGVDCAGDADLPALVALGFALANEQVRL